MTALVLEPGQEACLREVVATQYRFPVQGDEGGFLGTAVVRQASGAALLGAGGRVSVRAD